MVTARSVCSFCMRPPCAARWEGRGGEGGPQGWRRARRRHAAAGGARCACSGSRLKRRAPPRRAPAPRRPRAAPRAMAWQPRPAPRPAGARGAHGTRLLPATPHALIRLLRRHEAAAGERAGVEAAAEHGHGCRGGEGGRGGGARGRAGSRWRRPSRVTGGSKASNGRQQCRRLGAGPHTMAVRPFPEYPAPPRPVPPRRPRRGCHRGPRTFRAIARRATAPGGVPTPARSVLPAPGARCAGAGAKGARLGPLSAPPRRGQQWRRRHASRPGPRACSGPLEKRPWAAWRRAACRMPRGGARGAGITGRRRGAGDRGAAARRQARAAPPRPRRHAEPTAPAAPAPANRRPRPPPPSPPASRTPCPRTPRAPQQAAPAQPRDAGPGAPRRPRGRAAPRSRARRAQPGPRRAACARRRDGREEGLLRGAQGGARELSWASGNLVPAQAARPCAAAAPLYAGAPPAPAAAGSPPSQPTSPIPRASPPRPPRRCTTTWCSAASLRRCARRCGPRGGASEGGLRRA
jgi:hypothetical protein